MIFSDKVEFEEILSEFKQIIIFTGGTSYIQKKTGCRNDNMFYIRKIFACFMFSVIKD